MYGVSTPKYFFGQKEQAVTRPLRDTVAQTRELHAEMNVHPLKHHLVQHRSEHTRVLFGDEYVYNIK